MNLPPSSRFKQGWLKLFSMDLVVAAISCILSIVLFAFIADEIAIEKSMSFDNKVFSLLTPFISAANTDFFNVITFLGTGGFLLPAYLIITIFLVKKNKRHYAIMVVALAITSMVSGWILKEIYQRARPPLPLVPGAGGYSFPSGHSLGAFTFAGIVIYLAIRLNLPAATKWLISVIAFAFGILVGLSRVYLHVHYASDVIGSLAITIVWLSISIICVQRFDRKLDAL